MNLHIDPCWTFKQIIINIKSIKDEFLGKLSSFSYFKLHDKVLFLRGIKEQIYSLKIDNWKCSKIWEYLNDNIELEELNKYL